MPNVYIPNLGYHNYEDAKRFGELVPLTDRKKGVNVFAVDNLVASLTERLRDATGEDYVLLSGYNLINIVVAHYFLRKFGRVKVLMWEGNAHKYKELTLSEF